jgi:hypothetical protein
VTIKDCLVVEPLQLERLIRSLQLEDEDLNYTVECSDNTSLSPRSLNEVLDLLNPENRAITRIEISTQYAAKTPVNLNLRLGPRYGDGNASYRISGEDREVFAISGVIDDHIIPMKQKIRVPSSLGNLLHYGGLAFGSWTLFVGLFALAAKVWGKQLQINGYTMKTRWIIEFTAASFILVLIGWYWERLSNYLFPETAFLIGDGRARYERMLNLRRQLAWAVLAAFAVSVVVAFLFN